MSKLTLAMASAVVEQAVPTHAMARNIGGVSWAANATRQFAEAVQGIAGSLADQPSSLLDSVTRFMKTG